MSINNKLFHIGNDVVSLRKKFDIIDRGGLLGKKELMESFVDLLELINDIRLAIQDVDTKLDIKSKNPWKFKIDCTEEELLKIQSVLKQLQLNYEYMPVIHQN